MIYFKLNGAVYAFETAEEAQEFGPDGLVEMTPAEVAAHLNPPPPTLTQLEKDTLRFSRRAAVKDALIGWMAADNMARVRAGVWTVADLQGLLVDLGPVLAMMQSLSFELAAQSIAASTNPLMTAEIKAAWVSKLTENLFNS